MASQDINPHPDPLPGKQGEGNQGNSSTVDVTSPYTPRRPSPIVSISINHPIGQALRKIKNFLTHKQTLFSTSFTIKITPIVAIASLFGVFALFGGGVTTAFQFGKTVEEKFLASLSPTPAIKQNIPTPTPLIVSKSGTIQTTYQNPPASNAASPTSNLALPSPIYTNSAASDAASKQITSPPTAFDAARPILHYILTSRSGSITFLSFGQNVKISTYLGLRVLITGNFDSSKNTLTISKSEDIEVLQ